MALKSAYARLTGSSDNIARAEPENGLLHIAVLTLTKIADSLIDPKLVLAWLLNSLGAPGVIIGALVPVREAGSLLPQLAITRTVESASRASRIWSAAAAVQGLAAFAIAASVLLLEGAAAGWAVITALAVLAVARAAASVSYKDVLARTIAKGRRASITGFAAAIGSLAAFGFGLAMALGLFPVAPQDVAPQDVALQNGALQNGAPQKGAPQEGAQQTLAIAVAAAGGAFLLSSLCFLRLQEPDAAAKNDPDTSLKALFAPLFTSRQLQIFIAARACLTATALAPPFIVMLSSASSVSGSGSGSGSGSAISSGGALGALGPLVMASTAASVVAAYVWGRLSDRSSRQTLIIAGALSALILAVIGSLGLSDATLGGRFGAAAAIFAAQIAYEGVRQGRKLHLTDMADGTTRARYTALSNTLIGGALLAGGSAGYLADRIGPAALLLAFAVIALIGSIVATRLEEVQRPASGA